MDDARLQEIIRKVVTNQAISLGGEMEKHLDPHSGVISVRTGSVRTERFDTGDPECRVSLKDVLSIEESPRLGCGVMEMRESSFDWVLNYDEIDYIISGRLEILIGERKIVGEAGDVVFIPKNTAIRFSAPDFARFVYVTYPANWQNP
jgi:ethanolamine utilization protein EutQ